MDCSQQPRQNASLDSLERLSHFSSVNGGKYTVAFIGKALGGWSKLWTMATPRFSIVAGTTNIRIFNRDWATRGLASWAPNWKTRLIADLLRARPGHFLDVGANIGQTLLDWLAAPIRNEYVGFEPNSICVRHLNSVIEDNRISGAMVVPVGLSDDDRILSLYLSTATASDSGASTVADLRPSEIYTTIPVPVYRLDTISDTLPDGIVSLIKIDVEGAEAQTISGMIGTLRQHQPWVLCEVLHRDPAADRASYITRNEELVGLLSGHSYEIFRVVQSDDGRRVVALDQVAMFPDVTYSAASADQCDYLFLPAGQRPHAEDAILRPSNSGR